MEIEKTKTVTFKDLLRGNESFTIIYANKNGIAKHTKIDTPKEVLSFISENIYEIKFLSINDIVLDIDKIIEKYSR